VQGWRHQRPLLSGKSSWDGCAQEGRATMKIKQDDLGDVVVWRWIGWHNYSSKTVERTACARERIQSEVPASKPILVDLTRMHYSYTDSLYDALNNTYFLQRKGHPVAILLSPDKPKMRDTLRVMQAEMVVKVFEDEEPALAYLRSSDSSASGQNRAVVTGFRCRTAGAAERGVQCG
jgi:hypothetical protein